MCDRAARRWCWTVPLSAVIALVGGGTLAAQAAVARTADSLHALVLEARVRSLAADSAFSRARAAVGAMRDKRLVVGTLTVRFSAAELTDADTAAIAQGLEAGDADLVERFGEAGAAVLRSPDEWVAASDIQYRGMGSGVTLRASFATSGATSTQLRRPLSPESVRRFHGQIAAERLGYQFPWIDTFTGASRGLTRSEGHYAEVAREMSLSWAATGRRCAIGIIAACELVMTTRAPGAPTPAWFDPGDARGAATAADVPPNADSSLVVDRKTCLKGDMERCARILPRLNVRDPFSGAVRATLVSHAIELGGRDAIQKLRSAPPGTPLERLASVAGMSTDDLLRSWQARTDAALLADRESTIPLAASTVLWCALLVGVTTRRRP
jgi:hypothetical protein